MNPAGHETDRRAKVIDEEITIPIVQKSDVLAIQQAPFVPAHEGGEAISGEADITMSSALPPWSYGLSPALSAFIPTARAIFIDVFR